MSVLGYDIDRIVALSMARIAVNAEDDADCVRGYDRIVARYGADLASEVWATACNEYDVREKTPAGGDLTWVDQTLTLDAIDPAVRAIDDNPGWRLIGTGIGSGGQTTLTYGWPWPVP